MTHTLKKIQNLGDVEEAILYWQEKPYTKKELKNWETQYNTKLEVRPLLNKFYKPSRKVWALIPKNN